MITDLNEILVEWSYRTSDGKPDVKNNAKLIILESVLNDFGWNREARAELLNTLVEANADVVEPTLAKARKKAEKGQTYSSPKSKKVYTRGKEKSKDGEEKGENNSKDNPQSNREETISKVLDLFVPSDEQQTGAGRFAITQEDVDDYKDWLKLTSEEREAKQKEIVEKQKEKIGEVTDADIDDFEARLLEKLGKEKFKSLMSSIRKKGDPPSKYLKGKYPKGHPKEGQGIGRDRERQVIRHYLETGGVNPMNGKTVPFSEAQLDHITSLDNGGKDGGENWMWMEARINQFKGSLTDTEVESKLIERDLKTAKELDKETSEAELKNWQTQAEIAYWETRFEGNKVASLSVESIENMSSSERTNLVKAWNNYVGERDSRYIARYGTRKAEVDGQMYPITRDGAMKPDKNNPNTWGVQKQPDGSLKKTDMSYEEALAAYDDARASGGAKIDDTTIKEDIIKALTGEQSPFKDDEGNSITIPTKSEEDTIDAELEAIQGEKEERKRYIKNLQKDIRANPQSADNLKKQIQKDPEYKRYMDAIKKAAGKGKSKKPDNPEEYARLKKEYDEWRLNKWRGWQSLLKKN